MNPKKSKRNSGINVSHVGSITKKVGFDGYHLIVTLIVVICESSEVSRVIVDGNRFLLGLGLKVTVMPAGIPDVESVGEPA
jgi:hypothetical protein